MFPTSSPSVWVERKADAKYAPEDYVKSLNGKQQRRWNRQKWRTRLVERPSPKKAEASKQASKRAAGKIRLAAKERPAEARSVLISVVSFPRAFKPFPTSSPHTRTCTSIKFETIYVTPRKTGTQHQGSLDTRRSTTYPCCDLATRTPSVLCQC